MPAMRGRLRFFIVAATAALSLGLTADGGARDGVAHAAGWVKVKAKGAICAHGTPYAFWARRASSSKLLIFFQGGGYCSSYASCSGTGYDSTVGGEYDRLSRTYGIFDSSNPSNPFRNWSMVFVSYCTGDLHWGNHVQTYTQGDKKITIRHKGFVNASLVLRWTYSHWRKPKTVLVSGCSAGSIGSAALAPYVIRHYPHARVNQLGDSFALLSPQPFALPSEWHAAAHFPSWISGLRALGRAFTMDRYYETVAHYYSRVTFSQFNWTGDPLQSSFYASRGGNRDNFGTALKQSLAGIQSVAPNFRSYTAPGVMHCVLELPTVYTTTVGGVPLLRWVSDLANGKRPASVGLG
jgi:hypothetical protein